MTNKLQIRNKYPPPYVPPYRGTHADVIVYIFAHFAYGFAYRRKHENINKDMN